MGRVGKGNGVGDWGREESGRWLCRRKIIRVQAACRLLIPLPLLLAGAVSVSSVVGIEERLRAEVCGDVDLHLLRH